MGDALEAAAVLVILIVASCISAAFIFSTAVIVRRLITRGKEE